MRIMTNDNPSVIVTREVRLGGGLPGVEGLAEDIARGSLDLSQCRPEMASALREARARGLWGNPKEAATFALAFVAGAKDPAARSRTAMADVHADADRRAEAERRRQDAERRAAVARETARVAAEHRALAMDGAREAIRGHRYVPEEAREDIARIMVERGMGPGEAYDAWIEEGEPSPPLAGRLSSYSR